MPQITKSAWPNNGPCMASLAYHRHRQPCSARSWHFVGLPFFGKLLARGIGPLMDLAGLAILGDSLAKDIGPFMDIAWLVVLGESLVNDIGPFMDLAWLPFLGYHWLKTLAH